MLLRSFQIVSASTCASIAWSARGPDVDCLPPEDCGTSAFQQSLCFFIHSIHLYDSLVDSINLVFFRPFQCLVSPYFRC